MNHIHQITLPTPFLVGDVHVYLIQDDAAILVDCGPKTDQARTLLENELKKFGLTFSDIDQIWLTHSHPDHIGLAGEIASASGASIIGHKSEKELFAGRYNGTDYSSFFSFYDIPEPIAKASYQQYQWFESFFDPVTPDRLVDEYSYLSSGSEQWSIIELPGHSPGQVGFLRHSDNTMIAGDALLETITSNALINFDENGKRYDSLQLMRKSLKRCAEVAERVLPGHGNIIEIPQSITGHHLAALDKRYAHILKSLESESSTLFEMVLRLFPFAKDPKFAFLPISEVIGYLDWGISLGKIEFSEGRFFHA